MNKKDLKELKTVFSDDCGLFSIDRVLTTVITPAGEVRNHKDTFFSLLPLNEADEIFNRVKSVLTGKLNKNCIEYTDRNALENINLICYEKQQIDYKSISKKCLNGLKEYAKDTGTYKYYIATKCTYTMYNKEEDKEREFNFILSCLCPINLSEREVKYDSNNDKVIIENNFNRNIGTAEQGFLFPVLTDRFEDRERIMIYTKSPTKEHIIEFALGFEPIRNFKSQKNYFDDIVTNVFAKVNRVVTLTDIITINNWLKELNYEKKDDSATIGIDEIVELFKALGITEDIKNTVAIDLCEERLTISNLYEETTIIKFKNNTIKVPTDELNSVKLNEQSIKIGSSDITKIADINGLSISLKGDYNE